MFSSSIADVMRSFVQLCSSSSQCFPWMMDELLSSETSGKTNLNNSIKHEPCTPWKHLKTHFETQEKWIHGHMIHMILYYFPINILPPKPFFGSSDLSPDAALAFLAPAPWRNWSPVKTAACVCTAPDGAHPAGTPCVAIACNG